MIYRDMTERQRLCARLLYCGNAHPADRFIGAPCGCVYISKQHDVMADGTLADLQPFLTCDDAETSMPCARPYTTAAVYHWVEIEAQGVNWQ